MPTFTYQGPGRTLVIAGRRLTRGVPTELTGRAADAASAHAGVTKGKAEPTPTQTTPLENLVAYIESGTADVGELTTRLVLLDEATRQELAAEYEIEAEAIEGPVLTELATAMLAEHTATEPAAPLTGKALDDRIAELGIDAKSGGSNADGSMNADEKRAAIAAAGGS